MKASLHPVLRQWATYRETDRTRWISAAPTDLLRMALQTWEDAMSVGRTGTQGHETEAVIVEVRRVLALRSQEHRSRMCPACGYAGLSRRPYVAYEGPEMGLGARPPYGRQWGDPSHDRCPCCGYRFGYHDALRSGETPVAFEDWRAAWLACGTPWSDVTKRPRGWDAIVQLTRAALWDCIASVDGRVLTLYNRQGSSHQDRESEHGHSHQ